MRALSPAPLRAAFATMSGVSVAQSLQAVRERVDAAAVAAARAPSSVRLVAVSKTKPAELVREAYQAGQRHFGENYAQELVEKAKCLPADLRWHYIGNLQSNKARALVSVSSLWCVETVDRVKIADTLDRLSGELRASDGPLNVMVQVNVSAEQSKSGASPEEAPALAKHIADACPNLRLLGVMTIGRPDASMQPEAFRQLRDVRARVAAALGRAEDALELSMGMSADFETAIAMGSNNVRVGSTIFGERNYGAAAFAAAGEPQQ